MDNTFKGYLQKQAHISDEQFTALTAKWNLGSSSYPKGKVLLKPGGYSGKMYFVTKGILRAYMVSNNGKEHIIQFAPENWWIGDRNSAYFNEPATYYIDVIEEAEVVALEKGFLEEAQVICPDFTRLNTFLLHNNIRHLQNRICLLLGATAEERYLDFIELYPNLTLRVSQIMIASYLGITPESLSRVRRELAAKHFKR